jgi:hypothetical protein
MKSADVECGGKALALLTVAISLTRAKIAKDPVKIATKPDLVEGKASTLELLLCRVAGFVKHIFK